MKKKPLFSGVQFLLNGTIQLYFHFLLNGTIQLYFHRKKKGPVSFCSNYRWTI